MNSISICQSAFSKPHHRSTNGFSMTLPVCLPALLDIASYLFVNALATTSAVVFFYLANTIPASGSHGEKIRTRSAIRKN
ncbi:hypothetical protein DU976_04605 [Vibrio navarrensis]|nr:hypothetical protein [Vibrio navarrensis]MBH9738295.1 hypothetical protein [Vibrio navarrensis]